MIFAVVFIVGALVFEALAHNLIIRGLTRCGQPKKENQLWHIHFFLMWTCLSAFIISIDQSLWKLVIFLATSRLFVFSSALNLSRGKKIYHLGSDFIDSTLKGLFIYFPAAIWKKVFGKWPLWILNSNLGHWSAFLARAVIWVGSIILIFHP